MNVVPACVCRTVLSRSSLRNCTCGAISEPNAAVAMRQPPPFSCCAASNSAIFLSTASCAASNSAIFSSEDTVVCEFAVFSVNEEILCSSYIYNPKTQISGTLRLVYRILYRHFRAYLKKGILLGKFLDAMSCG